MSIIGYALSVFYFAGIVVFLWVGFRHTQYSAILIVPISVFWLPATIIAWIVGKLQR